MSRSVIVFALVCVVVTSCGGGESSTCNVDYDCAAGQTCWTTDGRTFSCMKAGSGSLGSQCDASVAGIASPSCSDGLTCLAVGPTTVGSCVAWCGGRTCPADTTCASVTTTRGASLKVCLQCNVAYDCSAGQTCASSTGTSWSCVPAGTGSEGEACDASVGAPLVCGDRLVCLATTSDPTNASCIRWCDATHPCESGKTCQEIVTTKGATLPVCL